MPRVRPGTAPLTGPALLQLMWLASPALPVGGFSYSEGLEAAVDGGQVPDEAGAAGWLGDQLSLSLQRADLPLVASAHRAWQGADPAQMIARIADLNAWALQTRETREFRQQAEQMGRSLTDWLRQRRPDDARVPLLAALADALPAAVDAALATAVAGDHARQNLTPMLAIVSARHEAQYSRLFRS
jgi:urease accessory protein